MHEPAADADQAESEALAHQYWLNPASLIGTPEIGCYRAE